MSTLVPLGLADDQRVTQLQSEILSQVSTLFSTAIREMDREHIQASLRLYETMDGVEEGMTVIREVVTNICQQVCRPLSLRSYKLMAVVDTLYPKHRTGCPGARLNTPRCSV